MGDFLGGIFDLFAAGADWAHSMSSVLFYVFSVLQAVASFLYRVLTNVFLFLFRAAARLAQFLRHAAFWLYNNILKRIYDALKAAQEWIEKRLKPIIDFLTKLRARFDKIFKVYIKPILDLIQHVRQVLQVLRLLHVKWAAELDAKLAQIQAEILKPFLLIRAMLNKAIDLALTLAKPYGLARFALVGLIGQRGVAAITRLVTGAHVGFWFPNLHSLAHPWERPVTDARKLRDHSFNPGGASLIAPLVGQDTYDYAATEQAPSDADIDAVESTFTFSVTVTEYMNAEDGYDALSDNTISLDDAVNRKVGVLFDAGHGVAKIVLAGAGV